MVLTKTDYLAFKQCPKNLWLMENKDQLNSRTETSNSLSEKGNFVTEVARELFPGGVLVKYDGYKRMLQETSRLVKGHTSIIYEGTFEYNGVLVRCEI